MRSFTAALAVLLIAGTAAAETRLRLATTTSPEHSGLLGAILPRFQQESGITVDVIAVGSGKALKLGENGDVDVLLVHAPAREEAFVAAGFGVERRTLMANDFVIVGPPDDPAGVRAAGRAADALRRIAGHQARFISRGDASGTHDKELEIWRAAGIEPAGAWYVSAGRGMGPVLQLAFEKRAYTLSDRGTFLAYRAKGDLAILSQGDPVLVNTYSLIAVNPTRHPAVRHREAMALIEWLTSPEGQRAIGEFRVDGEVLFHPRAVPVAD